MKKAKEMRRGERIGRGSMDQALHGVHTCLDADKKPTWSDMASSQPVHIYQRKPLCRRKNCSAEGGAIPAGPGREAEAVQVIVYVQAREDAVLDLCGDLGEMISRRDSGAGSDGIQSSL